MSDTQPPTEKVTPDVIVRRALYDRLPASAFAINDHVDWVHVGNHWVDFQKLCEGIVEDLQAVGVGVSEKEQEQ